MQLRCNSCALIILNNYSHLSLFRGIYEKNYVAKNTYLSLFLSFYEQQLIII